MTQPADFTHLPTSRLLLIPAPQHVDLLGPSITLPSVLTYAGLPRDVVRPILGMLAEPAAPGTSPVIKITFDAPIDTPCPEKSEQRYALHIAEPSSTGAPVIRITSPSITGARYALATLKQLLVRYSTSLPSLLIRDEPSFATRGVMLDISRDRVPTMQSLIDTVHTLADLKINHLQLYTEHTFAYTSHEVVWQDVSPMTAEQIRRLDVVCKSRGIELAANQNCFGHMHKWLNKDQYKHLAETTGEWMFGPWKRTGPWSLCPTDPRTPPFVESLLDELLPNFTSPRVNIGCDETFDIEFGRSKNEVARRGRSSVYFDFVKKICKFVRNHKKRPMFWADMLESNLEAIREVPEDLICLAWGYEADHDFSTIVRRATLAGREAWVCPGTSTWLTWTGRTSDRAANLASAARQGLDAGATGYLTTDWGDQGHRQQPSISMTGLAHGAHASWNALQAAHADYEAISLHALRDRTLQAAPLIARLGDLDKPLRDVTLALSRPAEQGKLRNASALFVDLQLDLRSGREVGDIKLWRDAANTLAAEPLPSVAHPHLPPLLAQELDHALICMRFAATRALARRYPAGLSPAGRKVLAEQLRALIDQHRALWAISSRPGGLALSCSHYEKAFAEITA